MNATSAHVNLYKIGAIAVITGLSTHTIRAWERRYGLELADRTEGGTRLYSNLALEKLKLIKSLLDQGESISVLSDLTTAELKERLELYNHSTTRVSNSWTLRSDSQALSEQVSSAECRLIYKSKPNEEFVSNETVADIVSKGAVKNRDLGITGLLILTGNEFLQVLEGPCKAVNELYLTIAKDKRHYNIQLVSFEQITQRFFQSWNMRLVDLWDLPGPTRQFLSSKYKSEDGMIRIPDSSIEIHSLLLDARAFCLSEPWKGRV